MKFRMFSRFRRGGMFAVAGLALCGMVLLSACSSTPDKPKPVEIGTVTPLITVTQKWQTNVGAVNFPLRVGVAGENAIVASSDGTVVALDSKTGSEVWRVLLNTPIAAGVGTDGGLAAVVTQTNDLVAIGVREHRELWRQKLNTQAYTAPFVAGGRVFVLTADRAVAAFDGKTGQALWRQQRPSEPLILKQPGVLLAVGDTLVVGLSGRLSGLNPNTGSILWEVSVAAPRGINEVERLVDIVGPAARSDGSVCVRAFQARVGCVNAVKGDLLWSKQARGAEGLAGDARLVFGIEADGTVLAWRRTDGERIWSTDRLRYRALVGPTLVGRSVVVVDASGFVYFLSRDDGSLLQRLATDGSASAGAPHLVGSTLVVVNRSGRVLGFQPQ